MSTIWEDLFDSYPPGLLEFICLTATQIICFWTPATLLLLLDILFPAFSNRHKIQSERRQPTWVKIKHCVKYVAINNIQSTLLYFFVSYLLGFKSHCSESPQTYLVGMKC